MRHTDDCENKRYYFPSFLIYNAKSLRVAPVAQLDRVPGFEPGGRGCESLRARQNYQGMGVPSQYTNNGWLSKARLSIYRIISDTDFRVVIIGILPS